ncbi:hypothetical protein C1I60_12870 [Paenibacillus terrae]|uniref:Uncharacterized protein n=1 Tax=Paenibacillus terrae TaxID=159743 RepID=A0A4U2PXA3_9BACL|nr:hypothetical protein [Paenibacillus terrae]TKH44217.1 hypothetical protein C1I60_12870 [Paenibacillus terrae]
MSKKLGRPFKVKPEVIDKWIQKYGDHNYVDYKIRAINFTEKLISKKVVKYEHEYAAYLLHCSLYCRIVNCRHGAGIYKGVHCDWKSADEAFLQVLEQRKDFWEDWVRVTTDFVKNGQHRSDRPTVDRILEDGGIGYTITNIQVLTSGENSSKAKRIPHYLIKVYDSHNPKESKTFKKYASKSEALAAIGLTQTESDCGNYFEIEGCAYLLQSEALTHGEKELIQKEEDDDKEKTYRGSILIATIELGDGRTATISKEFTYTQSAVIFKEPIAD